MPNWPAFRQIRPRRRTALVMTAALLTGLLPLGVASHAAADDPAPIVLASFEGAEPFASPPNAGIFGWGSDGDDPPTMELQTRPDAPQGEKVLHGTTTSAGTAASVTTSPSTRTRRTGRAQGLPVLVVRPEHRAPSARFRQADLLRDQGRRRQRRGVRAVETSFTDDWQGWHLVEIPFTDLVYRGDYQPVGGIDQILNLIRCGATRSQCRSARRVQFAIDEVEIYGRPSGRSRRAWSPTPAVYPVAEGGTAQVRISVATLGTTAGGASHGRYRATGTGTAGRQTTTTPSPAAFTFPAGTASGTVADRRGGHPARTVTAEIGRDDPARTHRHRRQGARRACRRSSSTRTDCRT